MNNGSSSHPAMLGVIQQLEALTVHPQILAPSSAQCRTSPTPPHTISLVHKCIHGHPANLALSSSSSYGIPPSLRVKDCSRQHVTLLPRPPLKLKLFLNFCYVIQKKGSSRKGFQNCQSAVFYHVVIGSVHPLSQTHLCRSLHPVSAPAAYMCLLHFFWLDMYVTRSSSSAATLPQFCFCFYSCTIVRP
jgi:hypothetical protein